MLFVTYIPLLCMSVFQLIVLFASIDVCKRIMYREVSLYLQMQMKYKSCSLAVLCRLACKFRKQVYLRNYVNSL